MTTDAGFQERWLDIDADTMARYEEMFRWSDASEAFHAPARIGAGQVVGDFGCGPGYTALEFARRVGPEGHVHAFDINAEFVASARRKAAEAGLADRITVHLLTDAGIPLPAASVDTMTARNTLIYVEDPVVTLREFRRCLRPGGRAHVIEGDWSLMVVEPVPTAQWRALIEAARGALPRPEIGRALYGLARTAGFQDIAVEVITRPDTTGRLMGMIETAAEYATTGGAIDPARVEAILAQVRAAQADGTYLAVAPQFVVTAVAP